MSAGLSGCGGFNGSIINPTRSGYSPSSIRCGFARSANISFEVDRCEGVLKIPNSALRFFPTPQHVRKEDRPILEGKIAEDEEQEDVANEMLSARDRAEARRARNRRHVWVVAGYELRAVEVVTGLSDSKFTQLVSGDLKAGDKLVTGIQPAINGWGG